MATPAAILSVLVQARGVEKTAAQLSALDAAAKKAEASQKGTTKAFGDSERGSTRLSGALGTLRSRAASTTQAFTLMRSSMGVTSNTMRDVDRGGRSVSRRIREIVSVAGGGTGGIDTFGRALSNIPGAFSRLGAMAAMLAVGLIALIGPLVAVASALAPLVGLAAGVGAGMVAAAQGFGVFKLATMGVMDALKEQTTGQAQAAKQAVSSAGQQRAAARAVQAAQEGVRAAAEGVRRAADMLSEAYRSQREAVAALGPAYTAARRAMTDMGEAVRDAALSLRGARFAAQDARAALRELLGGPSPRALADAHRSIEDALRGESSAAFALADAHRALNELLQGPSVLDRAEASDAVADAMRGEERARLALNTQIKQTNSILKSPGASEDEKAQARLDLADAENSVGDAARDTTRARERLGAIEAGPDQAAIAQARERVTDAERGVADAARGTADARDALKKLEASAARGVLARARHDVALAENALGDAQRDRIRSLADLNLAEALGVRRSPEIVAARERIRDASRSVADAERGLADAQRASVMALQGLADAQASAGESAAGAALGAATLNEKLSKLPPAAQAFVRQLVAMKPRLDELRETAAGGFFPGATAGLKAAEGSFGSVNKVVGQTAGVLGEAARKSGELVGSPAFGNDIATIGGRNAKVIETMGEALRHVISALRHVLVAAGPLTQWLADVANKWALNAAEAAKAGRESGKLAAFFEKTKAVAQRLGSILGHLGSALFGIGKVGSVSGNEILASIDRAAARFDAWANSVKGRTELQDFFRRSQELAASLVPVIAGVVQAFGLLALKLLPLTTFFALLGPLADEATIAFIGWKIAATGAAIAGRLIRAATLAWAGAQWLLNAALAANPIGLVIVGLVALGAALVIAYQKSETFRAIVGAVWAWMKQAATDTFGWVKTAVINTWNAIQSATSAVWGAIRSIFTGHLSGMRTAVTTYFTAYRTIITGVWTAVQIATAAVWTAIRTAATLAWEGLRLAATTAWDLIRTAILTPLRAARDVISDIWHSIGTRAASAWENLQKGVTTFAGNMKDAIVNAFEGAANKVLDFVNAIIGVINKIPGVDIKKIEKLELAKGGVHGKGRAAQALARGGVVNKPIVMMGEEAPRHPEYVIPTNPAYRGRAQMLLGQAANAVGFQAGGVYSFGELKKLASRAGMSDPSTMAAIALAESSGNPRANGPPDGRGLWQIEWPIWGQTMRSKGLNNAYDPQQNAMMAKIVQAQQGLTAWVVYNTGAYKKYMSGGGGGGIVGAVGGILGDLLSGGAGFILDKLPGVGDLPDWLHGTGKFVLDKASEWIKKKVSDVIGLAGGGGAVGGGVSGSIKGAMAMARAMGLTITSTTGGQHAKNSWHYKGRAADVAGPPGQMAAFFDAALAKYGKNLLELFYDPRGAIKNGSRIGAIGGHSDHVHIALAKGGIFGAPFVGSYAQGGVVPRDGFAQVHAGETITAAGERGPLMHVEQLNVYEPMDFERELRKLAWAVETA